MKPGHDYAYPYYRDQAFCLAYGMTEKEALLSFLAKEDDPNSGGRQMPQHFGHTDLNIINQSSNTGTQYLQAVGAAFALQREKSDAIVYVSSGEGTTSQGDFHEALNWSSRNKAPVIFHIHNNGYAISVPVSEQISGESVYKITAGYENLARISVDGTNYFESLIAFKKSVDRARKGHGPTVIESNVVRLFPHSSSDDHRKYRAQEEIDADKLKDPILQLRNTCIKHKIAKETEFDKIDNNIFNLVNKSTEWAEIQENPDPSAALKNLYAEKQTFMNKPDSEKEKIVMVDAINHALDEELAFNDKALIYGEDVGGGKGGVFTATRGLTDKHGKDRVFNSPLAESSIVGTAIGMATLGYKPIVEIQFGDYIWPAFMQIRNEMATLRYRSNGQFSCPFVIRVPVGGYIHGSIYHSQSIDGYITHIPGIRVAFPSNASDAKGLLKAACRMDDPVIFLEHKGLYRQGYAARPEPDENYLLEFGKAKIIQEGTGLTIVTWGAIVQKSIEAAKESGYSVEIIDLRTLNPLDMNTILESVKRTNRVIVAHEDVLTNGFGGEIASRISDEAFTYLDAPVKRVASKDSHVAYAPVLEDEILVQTSWILNCINELMKF